MSFGLYDLPHLNAALNTVAAACLTAGYVMIRRGRVHAHVACMVSALIASAAFLTSYLIYHYGARSIPFTATGPVRTVYFTILISHIILAVVNLPMIAATVIPAVRRRFKRHRAIARWTLPVWLYVSVTGVVVYIMLYHWFRSAALP